MKKKIREKIGEIKKELQGSRRNNVIVSNDWELEQLCSVSPGEQKENWETIEL
jgi:hypothetical protein